MAAAEKACHRGAAEAEKVSFHFRIVCVAAAYQKPWSRVVDPFVGCAECLSENPLLLSNSQDRALRVHYFISRFSKDVYANSTSVDERSPTIAHPANFDIGAMVGPRHNVVLYVSQPFAAQQIRAAMFDAVYPAPCTTIEATQQ